MTVTLFRPLPSEGRRSMERYADALATALARLECDARSYVHPRPLPRLAGRLGALADHAWRTLAYPGAAAGQQGDVNHIVDHAHAHLIGALDATRTIVTCHDLAPLEHPERGWGLSRRLWARSFRAMLGAAHLIADSHFTRAAILRRSDYPAARITVVPLGVAAAFFVPADGAAIAALRARHELGTRPVLLHVGSCRPRKSIETLLAALAQLGDEGAVLVQVGGRFGRDQRRCIAGSGLAPRVRTVPFAPEAELHTWYQLAQVFVLPSVYEGFGLPVLEAMAAGTPVVCAHAGALPEVAGEAALLVPPCDPVALATAVRSLLADPERAAQLRRSGRRRAEAFSWERTARATRAVYAEVRARR